MRARYYDPATGQFLTRDPIERLTGEPYGYVGGNPLNGVDSSGLIPAPVILALTAVLSDPVVVGLVAGALGSFFNQMILSGGNITKVNPLDILISAGVGGGSVFLSCGPACVGGFSGLFADLIVQASHDRKSVPELLAAMLLGGFLGNYAGTQVEAVPGNWSMEIQKLVELGLAVFSGTLDVSSILSNLWQGKPAAAEQRC